MSIDGSNNTNLTTSNPGDNQPAWSPDGTKIAFTSNRTGSKQVWVMNADGSNPTQLTASPLANDSQPRYSPDGTKIAFTSDRSGVQNVWVMNADGTAPTNLTNDASNDSQPTWSADGTKIAFVSDRSGFQNIWVMNAAGMAATNLTNDPANDTQPSWSPGGTKIVFTSDRTGNSDVWVMDADGSSPLNVTNDSAADTNPTYSPDGGTRIFFTSDRTGTSQVFYVTTAGYGFYQANISHPGSADSQAVVQPLPPVAANGSPVQHVVVIDLENHSFDNLLGKICVEDARCDGVTTGQLANGTTINLPPAADIVAPAAHSYNAMITAINGGQMNGFSKFPNCNTQTNYRCYQQFDPSQIPNTAALARAFTISDHMFQLDNVPSWGAHIDLAAATSNGFYFGQPVPGSGVKGPGWGCDSGDDATWQATTFATSSQEPTCIPAPEGAGPYRQSKAPWVPTIMERMTNAGLSWKIYAPASNQSGYDWAICPTFATCLYGTQQNVQTKKVITDAQNGNLPNLSLVIPTGINSQHNGQSMIAGDNWLQSVIGPLMSGPEWSSTAIFVTWDDCGCFYDHSPPPPTFGIRVPLIIISPYAKPVYTDTNIASFPSLLAYTEHTFGLAPLGSEDANAYDFSQSFDYTQQSLVPIGLSAHPVPPSSVRWLKAHPDVIESGET